MSRRSRSRNTLVCPCHDATLDDLERMWEQGHRHPETLKRATAVFMGSCQGKHCAGVFAEVFDRLSSGEAGRDEDGRRPTVRPPLYPVRLGSLADPGTTDCAVTD